EIEIATWRPAPFFKPAASPAGAEIEFLPDDEDAAFPTSPAAEASAPAAEPAPPEPEAAAGAAPAHPVSPDTPAPLETVAAPVKPEPARPATLEEARERIRAAETREDIADAALSYLEPFFPLVALLIARKDDVIGWQVRGAEASQSAFKAARVSFKQPSIFLNVRLSGAP